MKWVPSHRPGDIKCPEKFCFHWVHPGGAAAIGQVFRSIQHSFDEGLWTEFPDGGCACDFGKCRREEPEEMGTDYYERHERNLSEAGLPEFYFSTLENLVSKEHSPFVNDACKQWGREQLTDQELALLDQQETQ